MTSPSNVMLADRLREMADILEVQHEDGYRVAAYRRAARTLLEFEKSIDEVVHNKGLKGLIELPGIGRGIGAAIIEIVTTGRWNQLDRLSGALEPEQLFQTVPGVGPELAARIHNELNIDTLEQLEQAAHDGRLEHVPGMGTRRVLAIKGGLTERLGHRRFKRPLHAGGPPIALLLDVDWQYRSKASESKLGKIAPKRFNPEGRYAPYSWKWPGAAHNDFNSFVQSRNRPGYSKVGVSAERLDAITYIRNACTNGLIMIGVHRSSQNGYPRSLLPRPGAMPSLYMRSVRPHTEHQSLITLLS